MFDELPTEFFDAKKNDARKYHVVGCSRKKTNPLNSRCDESQMPVANERNYLILRFDLTQIEGKFA